MASEWKYEMDVSLNWWISVYFDYFMSLSLAIGCLITYFCRCVQKQTIWSFRGTWPAVIGQSKASSMAMYIRDIIIRPSWTKGKWLCSNIIRGSPLSGRMQERWDSDVKSWLKSTCRAMQNSADSLIDFVHPVLQPFIQNRVSLGFKRGVLKLSWLPNTYLMSDVCLFSFVMEIGGLYPLKPCTYSWLCGFWHCRTRSVFCYKLH